MTTNLFEKTNRLNETLLEQFSRASEMQMNALRGYADVAMEQAKKVSEVRDLDGLKTVAADQAESLKSLSEQFTADWKAWQDYFNESREQIQQAFESTANEANPSAAEITK